MMYGAGMGDSNLHDPRDLPLVLAGGGSATAQGRPPHPYPKDTPLANLHLTLLDKLGVHLERIGDSTGPDSTLARWRESDMRVRSSPRSGITSLLGRRVALSTVQHAGGGAALIEAVRHAHVETRARAAEQGVDVNATQGDGATALHWAVHWDDGGRWPTPDCAPAPAPTSPTIPASRRCIWPASIATERRSSTAARSRRQRRTPRSSSGETRADDVRHATGRRRGRDGAAGSRRERQRRRSTDTRSDRVDVGGAAHGACAGRQRASRGGADVHARSRACTQTVTSEVTHVPDARS